MLGVLLCSCCTQNCYILTFRWYLSQKVCGCTAGSLSLGMGLSRWCYRAFSAQERVGCCFIWVGCLVLERDVSCRVSLTCHSAICERGSDGHPRGAALIEMGSVGCQYTSDPNISREWCLSLNQQSQATGFIPRVRTFPRQSMLAVSCSPCLWSPP